MDAMPEHALMETRFTVVGLLSYTNNLVIILNEALGKSTDQ
jgi:hypothetical protein